MICECNFLMRRALVYKDLNNIILHGINVFSRQIKRQKSIIL